MTRRPRTAWLIVILLLAALPLTGCFSANVKGLPQETPTLGKQLIDLKQARDAGAISDQEYQRLKARLIESADKDCSHH